MGLDNINFNKNNRNKTGPGHGISNDEQKRMLGDIKNNMSKYKKGQDDSNVRKYHSQKLQAEINLQDKKEDLVILISNTYKNFKINESQMKTNLIIIESINTSLISLREEYQIGTKTITDLVEEEEKLLIANVNYLNSKKDYLLNYFKIKSLEGSLINIFEEYLP